MVSVSRFQKLWLRSRRPGIWPASAPHPPARCISTVPALEATVSPPPVTCLRQILTTSQLDGRARLSRLWVPTGGIAASSTEGRFRLPWYDCSFLTDFRLSRKASAGGVFAPGKENFTLFIFNVGLYVDLVGTPGDFPHVASGSKSSRQTGGSRR